MLRKTLIVAACGLAVTLGMAGCGEEALSQDKLVERLVDSGLEQKFADCVAKEMYPDLSEDEKKALNDEDADSDTQRKVLEKSGEAGAACFKEGAPGLGDPDAPEAPDVPEPPAIDKLEPPPEG